MLQTFGVGYLGPPPELNKVIRDQEDFEAVKTKLRELLTRLTNPQTVSPPLPFS